MDQWEIFRRVKENRISEYFLLCFTNVLTAFFYSSNKYEAYETNLLEVTNRRFQTYDVNNLSIR